MYILLQSFLAQLKTSVFISQKVSTCRFSSGGSVHYKASSSQENTKYGNFCRSIWVPAYDSIHRPSGHCDLLCFPSEDTKISFQSTRINVTPHSWEQVTSSGLADITQCCSKQSDAVHTKKQATCVWKHVRKAGMR
jgi:hypothetical protein